MFSLVSSEAEPAPKLRPSLQMFLIALVAELISLLLISLGFWNNVGTPSDSLTVFLICVVLAVVMSSLSSILAVVGLVRYRRFKVHNALLLVVSFLANPATVFLAISVVG
ncbi:hypothetical protein ACN08Z_01330 [Rothia sp. P7181]|uniref:hypothetical protein n=1 Tax=unclassified Rothia (in: high G+C Gram-positive bacteria) TaxID=2689056 RepID=UPI003AE5B599